MSDGTTVIRGDVMCAKCGHAFFRHLVEGFVPEDSRFSDLACVLDDCPCAGFLDSTPVVDEDQAKRIMDKHPYVHPMDPNLARAALGLKPATEAVVHPAHYNSGKIEVWDFIVDQGLPYCLGDATKYICRAGKKDSTKRVQDLEKAKQYIDREIRRINEEEAEIIVSQNIKAFDAEQTYENARRAMRLSEGL